MLAGAARAYLHRYGVLAGRRAVCSPPTTRAYDAARDLRRRRDRSSWRSWTPGPSRRSGLVRPARGRGAHRARGARGDWGGPGDRRAGRPARHAAVHTRLGWAEVAVDALLVCGGWSPAAQLYAPGRRPAALRPGRGAFLPDGALSTCGVRWQPLPAGGLDPLLRTGRATTVRTSWTSQRDVTVADVVRATGAGLRSVEHVKRYTTAGTAHDQGKTSGLLTGAALAPRWRPTLAGLGPTTFRPPYAAGGLRRAGRARTGVSCSTRCAPPRIHTTRTWPRVPRWRTSASGTGRGTSRARVRRWTPGGAARVPWPPGPGVAIMDVSPPSARSTCRGRMPGSSWIGCTPT